ncbi:MAG TPA: response regulator transcription factor [Gemmatimonadales bacterium]|nr:response regulator transcription factor [Gemmatimonadales bacterium]
MYHDMTCVTVPAGSSVRGISADPTCRLCNSEPRRREHGGHTRILIIDDDRRSAPRLHGVWRTASASNDTPVDVADPDPSLVQDLVARARALLAGSGTEAPARVELPAWPPATISEGELTLDLASQTVSRGNRQIKVTQTEFGLLLGLVRRRGAVASRQDLLREVWGDEGTLNPRVVDTHVARLRRKLEDDPRQPRHILTALTAGYRFQA